MSDSDPAIPQDLRGSRTVYYIGAVVALHLVDGAVQHAEISGVLEGLPDEVGNDDDPAAADPVACPVPLGRVLADAIQASLPTVVYRALNNGVTVFVRSGPRLGGEPFTVYAN